MALITKGKSHAKGEYASMDLTSVVGTLESHWVVLDAELAEIKKDIASLRSLTRKYGEYWNRSLGTLKKLRVQKENLLKEIKFQMELFNLHIQQARAPAPPRLHKNCACAVPPLTRRAPPPQGRDLCYKLSNPGLASTIKTAPAQLQAQLAIEVVSPILANANNPLTVVR